MGLSIFLGRSQSDLCPVAAMLAYLAVRGINVGPLFQFANGRPLTHQRVVDHLRDVLMAAGVAAERSFGHEEEWR